MSAVNTVNPAKEFFLFLALILLSLFVGFKIPIHIIGFFIIILTPVAITVFSLRHGLLSGTVLLFALLVLLSVWWGQMFGVTFFFEFGFLSLALAHGFKQKLTQEKIVLFAFLVNIVAAAALLGIMVTTQGISPKEYLTIEMDRQVGEINRAYEQMDLDSNQKAAIAEGSRRLKQFVLLAYPGMYISLSLFLVIANYIMSRIVLVKLGYIVADRTPFSRLLIPEGGVWGLIASILLWLLGLSALNVWGINAMLVFLAIYTAQGMAIGLFFWTNKRMTLIIKLLVAGTLIIQPVFMLLLFPLGLFDTWFDFRKIKLANA